MDGFGHSLATFLGNGAKDLGMLATVRDAAFVPTVMRANIQRLRAIYSRFVGVEMTDDQAKQKIIDRLSLDCCAQFFADNTHLISLMIAARDGKSYHTDRGLCGFTFDGPRDDGFPIDALRLCTLKGTSGKPKDILKVISDGRVTLSARMIDIDKFVERVFPGTHYSEPEERVVVPPMAVVAKQIKGPISATAAETMLAGQQKQLLIPGFEYYARLAAGGGSDDKPREKGTRARRTLKIDRHA